MALFFVYILCILKFVFVYAASPITCLKFIHFCYIRSILSTLVLFGSIQFISILFSPLWSIRSMLVLFGPLWSYLVHFGQVRSYSINFGPIRSIKSYSIYFCPIGPLWSYSVLISPILFYSVHLKDFFLGGGVVGMEKDKSTLVLFIPL